MDLNENTIVPVLNTTEFIETLSQSFVQAIQKNRIHTHPAVFVQGSPGVGKSQSIYQIAKEIEMKTKRKVHVLDIRLLLFSPLDLRGIPTVDSNRQKTIWLKPAIFDLEDNENTINIIFLDELTSAAPSIQAAAYQITLDKRIGEFELPKNTFIVASGNKLTDGAVYYDIPSPLKNRFMHFIMEPNLESWLEWAKNEGIHFAIMRFLKRNPQLFCHKEINTLSNIIVTPRSWELMSEIMYNTDTFDLKTRNFLISSIIGTAMTDLFLNDDAHDYIDEIYQGIIPKDLSIADINRINDYLLYDLKAITTCKNKASNVMNYLTEIPPDYAIIVFREIMKSTYNTFALNGLEKFDLLIEQLGGLTTYDA